MYTNMWIVDYINLRDEYYDPKFFFDYIGVYTI